MQTKTQTAQVAGWDGFQRPTETDWLCNLLSFPTTDCGHWPLVICVAVWHVCSMYNVHLCWHRPRCYKCTLNTVVCWWYPAPTVDLLKHRKNCKCCPVSLLNGRSQRLPWVQVLNWQTCSQMSQISWIVFVDVCKIIKVSQIVVHFHKLS